MNLFVAIVPLLLLSAVFVSVSSIDLGTPGRNEVPDQESDFQLILRVTPSAWWVDARGEATSRVDKGDDDALLDILDALHAAYPGHTSVLVACADDVEYSEVVAVLDVAALAGFADCALVGLRASNDASRGAGP
jgi:biopolymer transport protein ExbD